MEFLRDGENGCVVDSHPQEIARVLDQLYLDREKAKAFGTSGWNMMQELNINWDYVIDRLIKG